MKTKIFTLILSLLCLTVLFAACDKPCETHIDENNDAVCDKCGTEIKDVNCAHADVNADNKCDNCGIDVVVITEKVPAETETVEGMVVNPIPEDVAIGEYVNTVLTDKDFVSSGNKIENIDSLLGSHAFTVKTLEDGTVKYAVLELSGGNVKTLWEMSAKDRTVYEVEFFDYWFIITKTTLFEDNAVYERTKDVYTYGIEDNKVGDQINIAGLEVYNMPELYADAQREAYISYSGMIYAVDKETNEIIDSFLPHKFVKRPDMDEIHGKYGYTFEYKATDTDLSIVGVYVYDLEEWIECVYSYRLPSKYKDAKISVLNGGALLVSAHVRLADNAVRYDYLHDGAKYDMVYLILDPAAGSETEVEFGYDILSVLPIDKENSLYSFLTEKAGAYNLIAAYPVVDDYIDHGAGLNLLVDDKLNIIAEIPEYALSLPVDNNRFVRYISFNDGAGAYELLNEKGEFIDYIPETAILNYGYKWIGNSLYKYNNDELIDFDDYVAANTQYLTSGGFAILTSRVENTENGTSSLEYYSYIPGKTPVRIGEGKENLAIVSVNEYGYEISYTVTVVVDGVPSVETKYEFFNAEGSSIYTAASPIVGSYTVGDGALIFRTLTETIIVK